MVPSTVNRGCLGWTRWMDRRTWTWCLQSHCVTSVCSCDSTTFVSRTFSGEESSGLRLRGPTVTPESIHLSTFWTNVPHLCWRVGGSSLRCVGITTLTRRLYRSCPGVRTVWPKRCTSSRSYGLYWPPSNQDYVCEGVGPKSNKLIIINGWWADTKYFLEKQGLEQI